MEMNDSGYRVHNGESMKRRLDAQAAEVARLTSIVKVAEEFVRAVDRARELGMPPMLGPVLTPFMQLRAATGINLYEVK